MSSTAWYKTRSRKARADDLLGVGLTLLADMPPKETKFGGMKIVHVFEPAQSKTWRVMMTDTDIDITCDLVSSGLKFTFKKGKNDQYPRVVEYKTGE